MIFIQTSKILTRMKKLNFWFLASLLSGALLITSCSDKNNDSDPTPTPKPRYQPAKDAKSDGTKVNPADMTMSALSGFVYTPDSIPLQNVQVTSGTKSCLTGPDGGFVLDEVKKVGDRSIVKFSCNDYFDVIRSMPTVDGDVWEVVMNLRSYYDNERVQIEYGMNSDENNSVQTSQGMTVDLQANGFKYADSGEPLGPYDYVTAEILYLSPDDNDFATMMPGGDLAAIDKSENPVQLVSYGMVCVNLATNNGKRVQLADEKPATLTFPVPDRFSGSEIPDEIPLWSFDEEKGLWIEEGVAHYDRDNNVFVGEVKHFSWVNLDYPELRATLKVNLKDEAGNVIPNQAVDIDGQRTYFTDKNGVVECYVPINTDFYVTVRSRDYSNYSPEVKKDVAKITAAGETTTVDIVLPVMKHLTGKVVNSGQGNNLSSLWIEYGEGKFTKAVHTDAQGQFILNAPFDYTGAAKLVLLASDASRHEFDIELDGNDHDYTLSIETDKSTGGVITFTRTNGVAKSILISPLFVSDMQGVEIVDGMLNLSVNYDDLNIFINNYSESKTAYSDASIDLYTGDNDIYRVQDDTAYIRVTNNKYYNYTFNVDCDAQLVNYKGNNEYTYTTIGTLKGEISAPLLGVGKTIRNISAKSSSFPKFTPWINGDTAAVGLQITDSQALGTGVLLWFFGDKYNYNDYKAFRTQAKAALGEPVLCDEPNESASGFNAETYDGLAQSCFYKDGKFIKVSMGWGYDNPEVFTHMGFWSLGDTEMARVQVLVLEGLSSCPDYLMEGRHGHHHYK